MRRSLLFIAGLTLLIGCAESNSLPTDQGTGNPAGSPLFAGAHVEFSNVGVPIFDPTAGLLMLVGFAAEFTLADLCEAGPEDLIPLSPNSIAHVVEPPTGAFLAASRGQDVPVLVYEFEDDPCDGEGETLVASGTAKFHFTDLHPANGAAISNIGVRGTVDLEAGGQALLTLVGAVFTQTPDGTVRANTGTITLTPI
jgi:hypothetical protein